MRARNVWNTRTLPVYALAVAKGGVKLHKVLLPFGGSSAGPRRRFLRRCRPGRIQGSGFTTHAKGFCNHLIGRQREQVRRRDDGRARSLDIVGNMSCF